MFEEGELEREKVVANFATTTKHGAIEGKTKIKICDMIICSILAVLFGAQDWEDIHDFVNNHYEWLREFLLLTGGIPCAKTYERVFSMICTFPSPIWSFSFLICIEI